MKRPPVIGPAKLYMALVLGILVSMPVFSGPPAVLIRTTPVVEQSVAETLTTFGVLDPDPDQILSLSLPHAGLINRVWVRLGQRVNSGDSLLEIITAPDAHMQFLQAQSAVDFAQRELDRQLRLLNEQLATKAQVDAARKDLKDSHTTLAALQKRGMGVVKEILRAPVDGIITQLDVSQGQRVQADTTAMLIADEKRLIARLGVEPEDLGKVQVGTAVTIRSVFIPDLEVQSTIREVHAMINPSTHLVEVLAVIPEQEIAQLVLGSRILGRIHLLSHMAKVVPHSAVLSDGSETYLFIVNAGRAQRVHVQTGTTVDGLVEVSGDLAIGSPVVISGNYELHDGMPVREAP